MTAERCFHCNEPIPGGFNFTLSFDNQQRQFCCAGCQAIADTIISSGLSDYYRFRTEPASRYALPKELADTLAEYDAPDVLADVSVQQGDLTEISLSVTGISCAACAWLIEKEIKISVYL